MPAPFSIVVFKYIFLLQPHNLQPWVPDVEKLKRMCRSTEFHDHPHPTSVGDDVFKIRAFFVRLSVSSRRRLPDSLTALLSLPRIGQQNHALDIDGYETDIPHNSIAFLSLRWVRNLNGHAMYGTTQPLRASATQGMHFEVYLRETKVLKGVLRKNPLQLARDDWKLECKWEIDHDQTHSDIYYYNHDGGDNNHKVSEAEVCIAVEGRQGVCSVSKRVSMEGKREKIKLEDIPEEGKFEAQEPEAESCSYSSCSCCGDGDSDDVGSNNDMDKEMEEMEMEKEMEIRMMLGQTTTWTRRWRRWRWRRRWRGLDGLLIWAFGSCAWVLATWFLKLP